MEADWEVEIGGDAPVIDACWPGYVDLVAAPERAAQLPEVRLFPRLAEGLIRLNAGHSPVWTAKCDVWDAGSFDPYELDAPPGAELAAVACYIDVLPRRSAPWQTPEQVTEWNRAVCARLAGRPLRQCRADLVLRRAWLPPGAWGLGVTAYLTACASNRESALDVLGSALSHFATAICPVPVSVNPSCPLQ